MKARGIVKARGFVVCAVVVALVAAAAVPVSAQSPGWRGLLDRATQAAEKTPYVGEALWVTYEGEAQHVSQFTVTSSGDGEISVGDRSGYAVRLGDDSSGLADHERGWFVPLPAADLSRAHKGLSRLERKYAVEVGRFDRLLDRPCRRVDISRRSDGTLAERLWIDERSGLILRRETYDAAEALLRMVSYQRLDIEPDARDTPTVERATRGQRPDMERLGQRVTELDEPRRRSLDEAGWTIPDALPGAFVLEGAYAVAMEGNQPIQAVYGDGLYTVSLFEQQGSPDWEALPEGAVKRADVDYPVYEWPGAVPQRLVWEASGTTFSLVGDATPDELDAMLAALPRPPRDGFWQRVQRGLSRLWSWVSPWA